MTSHPRGSRSYSPRPVPPGGRQNLTCARRKASELATRSTAQVELAAVATYLRPLVASSATARTRRSIATVGASAETTKATTAATPTGIMILASSCAPRLSEATRLTDLSQRMLVRPRRRGNRIGACAKHRSRTLYIEKTGAPLRSPTRTVQQLLRACCPSLGIGSLSSRSSSPRRGSRVVHTSVISDVGSLESRHCVVA